MIDSPDPVLAHNPRDTPALLTILQTNTAGNRPTGAPLLLVQGTADVFVPQVLTDLFAKKACAAGDTVDYRLYPSATHLGVLDTASKDVAAWFADRGRGAAATSTCG